MVLGNQRDALKLSFIKRDMKKVEILIFLLVLSLNSCVKKTHEDISDSYRLHESEQRMEIPIEDGIRIYSYALHHYDDIDGVEYLTLEDKKYEPTYGIINFYRLDSCKLSHTVRINREGPNSIPSFEGHGVINLDDIVVSTTREKMYRVNRKGEILREYPLSKGLDPASVALWSISTFYYKPLVCIDGKIYADQALPYIRWNGDPYGNNFEFDKCPLLTMLDTVTGDCSHSKLTFPKLYEKRKTIGKCSRYSRIYDGKRFVYSFYRLSELYVSEDGETGRRVASKSRYIDEIKNEGYSTSLSNIESSKLYYSLPSYGNILYDKYRDVYYRFCRLGTERFLDGKDQTFCWNDFTIMIINSDFEVIGETFFKEGKYVPQLFFVNKDGLWLSENNSMRDDMTEDVLKFRCLKLVENE